MHKALFPQQNLFGFDMILVGDATVNRTNRSTLGFFVKTFALGTLVGYDVIILV